MVTGSKQSCFPAQETDCHLEAVLDVRSEMGSLSSLAPALTSHCPPAKAP